ncbi:hypothetical protein UY793_19550 [Escherichia coli]|nr:hypothetical protein [Escherichia coli]
MNKDSIILNEKQSSPLPDDIRSIIEHTGNRRLAMTDEQKQREWAASPEEYDAVYKAISDEIATRLLSERQDVQPGTAPESVISHPDIPQETGSVQPEYPDEIRSIIEHAGNRRLAMTDEQKQREWAALPEEYDAVYKAISDEIATRLLAERQEDQAAVSGNTPSKCFEVHLEGAFAALNEEYEKRYTSLISGIDAKSCLVLTDSIHFVNQIKDLNPGSSEFDERVSFLGSDSKLTPVVISGEEYLNWFEKNKDKVIELYKMEDATSFAAEAEAGKTPGTWRLFEEKMMKTIETVKSLLNDLRTKGTEHTPATGHTLADEHVAGNRSHSPA